MRFLFTFICLSVMAVLGVEAVLDDYYCGDVSCYDVLGVQKTAKPKEIMKAYRTKSKTLHPDMRKEEKDEAKRKKMENEYLLLNKAYDTLKTIDTRKEYDLLINDPFLYKVMKRKYYGGGKNVFIHPLLPVLLVLVVGSVIQHVNRKSSIAKEKAACIRDITSNEKWVKSTMAIMVEKGIEKEMATLRAKNPLKWADKALELNPVEMVLNSKPLARDEIFAFQAVIFPYTAVKFVMNFVSEYGSSDKKLTRQDKITKTANALGMSEAQLLRCTDAKSLTNENDSYRGELNELLKRKLWKPKFMAAYNEELMQKHLKKFPKHRRALVRKDIEAEEAKRVNGMIRQQLQQNGFVGQ